jgi:hypothetical protein
MKVTNQRIIQNHVKSLLNLLLMSILFTSCSTNDFDAIKNKTLEWNELNNSRDLDGLEELYHENVRGYVSYIGKGKMIKAKANFFVANPDFQQVLASDLTVQKLSNGEFFVTFDKKTIINGKTKSYPSYLRFVRNGNTFLIMEESDEITDKNRKYSPDLAEAETVKVLPLDVTKGTGILTPLVIVFVLLGSVYIIYQRRNSMNNQPKKEESGPENEDETEEDESLKKGHLFEEFVVDKFDKNYFELMSWQGDKRSQTGHFAKDNLNPDLVFQLLLRNGTRFPLAVECKYRSSFVATDSINICSNEQLLRYQKFGTENKMPVFLVLGMGGKAHAPENLYVFNVSKLHRNWIPKDTLDSYRKNDTNFYFNPDFGTLK